LACFHFYHLILFLYIHAERQQRRYPGRLYRDVTEKDEFWNIENLSPDGQLAIHRGLADLVLSNTGGFDKAARVFARHEIEPLQAIIAEMKMRSRKKRSVLSGRKLQDRAKGKYGVAVLL